MTQFLIETFSYQGFICGCVHVCCSQKHPTFKSAREILADYAKKKKNRCCVLGLAVFILFKTVNTDHEK